MNKHMSDEKARSRLSAPRESTPKPTIPEKKEESVSSRKTKRHTHKNASAFKLPKIAVFSLPDHFSKRVPLLGISILAIIILVYMLTSIYPDQIAHLVLYQAYIPLLIIFFIASWSLILFFTNSGPIGTLVGGWLTLLLFLKLQNFELSSELILLSGLITGTLAAFSLVVFKK